MLIKKLVPEAVIPSYAHPGDAGLDLVATSVKHTMKYIEYGTGLSFAIPEGFLGLLVPRSSSSEKHLRLANSVGILDAGYRGEVKFRYALTLPSGMGDVYKVGERIGQLVLIPFVSAKILEVEELPESKRGTDGFGSTGA